MATLVRFLIITYAVKFATASSTVNTTNVVSTASDPLTSAWTSNSTSNNATESPNTADTSSTVESSTDTTPPGQTSSPPLGESSTDTTPPGQTSSPPLPATVSDSNWISLDLRVPMAIYMNKIFGTEVEKENFTNILRSIYNTTEGYVNISDTRFRNSNSTSIVEFMLAIIADTDSELLRSSLHCTIDTINNTDFSGYTVKEGYLEREYLDRIETVMQLMFDRCNILQNSCPPTYFLRCPMADNGSFRCFRQSDCLDCGDHGQCTINKDHELVCRCHTDDRFAYSGGTCEIVSEKLELESKYIIAIAAGSGGVMMVIFVAAIFCLVHQVKRDKEQLKYYRSLSVCPDDTDIGNRNIDRYFLQDNNYETTYFNGLEEESGRSSKDMREIAGLDNPVYQSYPDREFVGVSRFYRDEESRPEELLSVLGGRW
ncbi:hypothetical protein ScPMuIL_017004 [Solemya velum]